MSGVRSERINAHGLSRDDFGDSEKRRLRQACGFGCVICGHALFDYAHVDPPFRDATEHDIERMALLCHEHHNALDRYRRVSPAQVMAARANPRAKQAGFAHEALCCDLPEFVVTIGQSFFFDCHTVLRIEGTDILRIDPPEAAGAPYRLSGLFCDSEGGLIANIVHNEIRYSSTGWDVVLEGSKITFREGVGRICLVLLTVPDRGLRFERIDMSWAGCRILADANSITINGEGAELQNVMFRDCPSCIEVADGRVSVGGRPFGGNVKIFGGLFLG